MNVLIAEDDADSRLILERSVTNRGHGCLVAEDGVRAFELFQSRDVDVIIGGWMMPGMDGIELCRRVRETARTTPPYFIVVTAAGEREHVRQAMREGADDFLSKPVDPAELEVRLHAAERVTSLSRELADQTANLERLNDRQLQLTGADQDRAELLRRERDARVQAEDALKLREDFLSIASHELKTPLTSLLLQVQMLQRYIRQGALDALSPERASTMIETVERQIRRLLKLSNDLLEVSRLASRRPTVEGRPVDLTVLVQTVVTHFHFELTKSGSVVNLRATPVIGMWEAAKLEQVVTNLLSNAIKYGRGKPIDVTVEEDGSLARLTIRDRGVGIAPDALERIFGRFERADASHNPGGLGLGLYLACQIVQAHGGAITATSELGNGSAFVVELPRRLPA